MLLSQLNPHRVAPPLPGRVLMVPLRTRTIAFLGLVAVISVPRTAVSSQDSASWLPIEQALGRTGAVQPGGVVKFAFPRRDLHVMVGNVAVRPALALGGWVAFKQVSGGMTMAMGDL